MRPHSSFLRLKMEGAVFRESLKKMQHVKSERGEILTRPFLDVCIFILPILDKFGPAVKVAKTEIGGNISRLESNYSSNETKFNNLFSFVHAEVETKTAKSSSSCTNALLWLTRSMDFLVVLFRNLHDHHEWTIGQVCADSYGKTLKPYHGWLASSSFTVAVKLVPERKKFMEVICGAGDVDADMDKFCSTFQPTLQEIYKFLAASNLDSMKAS